MCKVASLKYNQARLYTYYKCKRRLIDESEASIPNLVAIGQYGFFTGLVPFVMRVNQMLNLDYGLKITSALSPKGQGNESGGSGAKA